MKKKVLTAMKPKVIALGFTKEELESAADTVAGNLTEESTDEEINASIDAVIPYLKLGQKMATRAINAAKNESEEAKRQAEEEARKKAEEEAAASGESKNNPSPADIAKIVAEAVSAAVKPLNDKLGEFESDRRNKSYVEGLKERLKDVDPEHYALALEGKTFENEDAVEEFATKVEASWKSFTERHAKEGLSFTPPSGAKGKDGSKGDDIDSIVSSIEKGTKEKVETLKKSE